MNPKNHTGSASFYGLGIAPKILELLDRMKYKEPTPIQHKAIPVILEGKDIIGIAQTGTGKTYAFGIPIIQKLAQITGKALILVPTRELAIQVAEALLKLSDSFGIRIAVLIGGVPIYSQILNLKRNPRIIIATPGRAIDHLKQRTLDLNNIKMLVLDEADRMLDMGFAPQIEKILQFTNMDRQTLLFSATIPEKIVKIAAQHMKLPINVEIARSGSVVEKIIQELFIIKGEEKPRLLKKILGQYRGSVLLFARTKRGASRITDGLRDDGFSVAEIHSNRSLNQRKMALEGFKTGRYRILVATDIAARGIDVKGIELVINYDLPDDPENYIHRIGRTGRAGNEGRAISFATPGQRSEVRNIEKIMRSIMPVSKHPEFQHASFIDAPYSPSGRRQQSRHPSYGRTSGSRQQRRFR